MHRQRGLGTGFAGEKLFSGAAGAAPVHEEVRWEPEGGCGACDGALWAGHLGEPCRVLARCLSRGQSMSPWTLRTVQFAVVQMHIGVLKCQEVAKEVDAAVRTV